MPPRTVLVVLGLATLLGVGAWVAVHNGPMLTQELVLWTWPGQTVPARIQVGQAIVLSALVGATVVGIAWTWRVGQSLADAFAGKRAQRVLRQADAAYQHGLEALLDGHPDQALGLMAETLARYPDHARAIMTGADILRSLGRPAEAAEWRKRRLHSAPEDFAALAALAEDHRAGGELPQAATLLERLVKLRPRRAHAAAEKLREVQLEMGAFEAALDAHDRLSRMDPPTTPRAEDGELVRSGIETRSGRSLVEQGRVKDAQALLRKVVRRHPAYVPGHLAYFEALVADEREDEAITMLVDCFERTNDACLIVGAEQHFLEHRHDGDELERAAVMLSAMKRFAACSGARAIARAFLAKTYTRFEMLDEAASAFEALREEFPENPVVAYYAARIAEKQGRASRAASLYRDIIRDLHVLDVRYVCEACGKQSAEYDDRCPACRRWGTLAVETGGAPSRGPGPAPRPVFSVPDDDETIVEQDALA